MARPWTGVHPFTLSGFTVLWTLSSEYFSSFPYGTCLLSVSRIYLALDEKYHPYSACALEQAYSWKPLRTRWNPDRRREFHPLCYLFSEGIRPEPCAEGGSIPHNSNHEIRKRIQDGLLPVHSPLLRESRLISFPPLNNMLKFSG